MLHKIILGLLVLIFAFVVMPTGSGALYPVENWLPIALNRPAVEYLEPGEEIHINFKADPLDEGGWFVVEPQPASADSVKDYIDGTVAKPLLMPGMQIELLNGLATSALQALSSKVGEEVILPVVDTDQFNRSRPIIGFVSVKITAVDSSGGDKSVVVTFIELCPSCM